MIMFLTTIVSQMLMGNFSFLILIVGITQIIIMIKLHKVNLKVRKDNEVQTPKKMSEMSKV